MVGQLFASDSSPREIARGNQHAHCEGGNEPWRSLFNRRRYHELNVVPGQSIVTTTATAESGHVIGGLSGVCDGSSFISGYSAPFGGVDLVRDRETAANVATVVRSAVQEVAATGIRELRVRLAPSCYGENQPLVLFTMLNQGFSIERCELNQHIDLAGLTSAVDWSERLHRPARRALHALLDDGFELHDCETEADHRRAYQLLADNRARKGRTLSISADYLRQARAALPGRIHMHELVHRGVPVAAALNYDVRPGVRLVVAWGDSDHGLPKSPMLVLAHQLIAWALVDGITTLDLGISNRPVPGPQGGLDPDLGLVQFKRSLLARTEPRMTVVRRWNP
jgi:hypothetical protein